MQESKKVIAGVFSSIDVPNDLLSVLARSMAEESIRNGIKIDCQIAEAKDKFKLTDREIVVLVDNLAQLGIDVVPNKDYQYIPVDKRNEGDEHISDSYPGIKTSSVKLSKIYGSRYEDLQEEIKKLKDALKEDKEALKNCNKFKSPQKYQTLWQQIDTTEKRIKELEHGAALAKAGFVYLPSSVRPFEVKGFLRTDKLYMVVQASDEDSQKVIIDPIGASTESPFEKEDEQDAPSIIMQIKKDIQSPLPNSDEVTDIGEHLLAMVAGQVGDEDIGDMKSVKRFVEHVLDYLQQHTSDIFSSLSAQETEALKNIIEKLKQYNVKYKLNVSPASFKISLPTPSEPAPIGGATSPVQASLKTASTANPDKGIANALKHLDRISTLVDEYSVAESFKKSKTALAALTELRHAVDGLKYFVTETLPYADRTEKEAAVVLLQNIVKNLEEVRPSTQSKNISFIIASVVPVLKKATGLLLTIEEA